HRRPLAAPLACAPRPGAASIRRPGREREQTPVGREQAPRLRRAAAIPTGRAEPVRPQGPALQRAASSPPESGALPLERLLQPERPLEPPVPPRRGTPVRRVRGAEPPRLALPAG